MVIHDNMTKIKTGFMLVFASNDALGPRSREVSLVPLFLIYFILQMFER